MKLQKYFGKRKKRNSTPIVIRYVEGHSMRPALLPGNVVFGVRYRALPKEGEIVIAIQNNREVIKRIAAVKDTGWVFLKGDNRAESTDSRKYGWIRIEDILAQVRYYIE